MISYKTAQDTIKNAIINNVQPFLTGAYFGLSLTKHISIAIHTHAFNTGGGALIGYIVKSSLENMSCEDCRASEKGALFSIAGTTLFISYNPYISAAAYGLTKFGFKGFQNAISANKDIEAKYDSTMEKINYVSGIALSAIGDIAVKGQALIQSYMGNVSENISTEIANQIVKSAISSYAKSHEQTTAGDTNEHGDSL